MRKSPNLLLAAVLGFFLASVCAAQNCSPPTTSLMMTFGALPSGAIGTPYVMTLSATGGTPPYSWSAATLNSFDTGLPAGLSISQNGVITGTPASTAVTRSVSLTVNDSATVSVFLSSSLHDTCTQLFQIVINPSLYISSIVLPAGELGTPYNQILAASGATGAVTWSISPALPGGLTLNPSTGAITGTPTALGTFQFAVTLSDSTKQTATRTVSFTIAKAASLPVITTIAGNGTKGFTGDGGPALSAELTAPEGMAMDAAGNIYFADVLNNRIRKITPGGTISTVAGTGSGGSSGDGGPATSATLVPFGVAVDAAGNLYLTDIARIRKVALNGTISTVAGTGVEGFSGDGGAATSAQLLAPEGVAVDGSGNIYIADTDNFRIRKVTPAGIISTVAGNGTKGYSGDGGPATSAELNDPTRIAVDGAGNLYIADEQNNVVRKVTANGAISTLAGNGTGAYSGDSGPATSAMLFNPYDVAVDSAGNVYIADSHNNAIREVTIDGNINTVAGTGIAGFSGDGGPANAAQLNAPAGILLDAAGDIYIGDSGNSRIRKVGPAGAAGLTVVPSTLSFGAYTIGGTVPAAQTISLTSTNPASGLAFTSSLGSDCAWLTLSPASGSTPATVTASVNATGVTAGNHSCVITFNAAGVSPSPTVTATLSAAATTLSATPSTLSFGAYVIGATAPAAQTIALSSTNPASGLAFTSSLGSDCAWLTLAPASGATPVTVTASVNAAKVTAGSHSCVITFSAAGVSPSPTVTATLTATAPTLSAAPSTLSFGAYTPGGTVPAAQTISVTSTNPATGLAFTSSLGSDCAWLTLSPASGSTPATLRASVNSTGATTGNHSCVITFNASGVSPGPTVTATLSVSVPLPTLSATPSTLPFGNYTIGGTVPASQTISLTSTNPSAGLTYASALGSDCAWLNLAPASGATPVTVTASVNAAAAIAGSHSCVITFSALGVSPSPTVTATLTVSPALVPTLSATPTTLPFGAYTSGGTVPAAQTISLTSTNPSAGLTYTSALGSDCAWLNVAPASGGTPVTVTASVIAANATVGSHSCVITFSAAGVSPSPTVTATLTANPPLTPTLSATPATLPFGTYTIGGTVPAAQTISLTSTNPSAGLAYTSALGSDCAWLNLAPASGATPVTVTASVNAAGVTAGSHSCVITFSAAGVSPSPTVTATLTASAPPTLSAAPATLSFGTYTIGGTVPAAQTISVSSTNPATGVAFTSALGSDCAWLNLAPASGATPVTVTASVNTAGVTAGSHSCVITFSAAGVSPSPTVTATLTANAPPTFSAAPATLSFGSYTIGATAPAAQTISLSSTNPSSGTAFSSSLGSDCAWLTLSPASGSTPATLSASVNIANATLGGHSCAITFNASGVPPVSVTATVTVVAPTAPTIQITPSITTVSSIATGAGLTVNLTSPAPTTLTATLSLSFAPNAAGLPSGSYADPGLQFASGGTSTTLTINSGSTSATLPTTSPIQVGSVAGTITVTLTSLTGTLNGQNVAFTLPNPNPNTTIVVPKLAPVISSVKIINVTSTGFTLDIVASSTPRDIASASVTFTAASGDQLNGTSFPSISLSSASGAWFVGTNASSLTAGGAFDLQIPFTFSGVTTAIGSASVTLTNSVSTSSAVSGTM